jgi:hypothetical protein
MGFAEGGLRNNHQTSMFTSFVDQNVLKHVKTSIVPIFLPGASPSPAIPAVPAIAAMVGAHGQRGERQRPTGGGDVGGLA